jgi:class 3 adenylate cyclase
MALMSGRPPEGTVTFLFSDIERSTDLLRRLGDDAFATVRAVHRRLLREAFGAHGGHEIDTAGDGFFVAFDSARAAVAAAVEAQRALASSEWPDGADVRVRIGLHTAEPHLAEDGYVGVGVHRAARICDAAGGGQILVSNATAGIVEDVEAGVEVVDVGEHRLKGLPRPQHLFQIRMPGLEEAFDPSRTAGGAAHDAHVGTFVFCDLSAWRCVIHALGDEGSTALAREYHATVSACAADESGVVFEAVADHVLAVFGSAGAALRAAGTMLVALADFTWPPECEVAAAIAVHSGRWSGDPLRVDAPTALLRVFALGEVVEPGRVFVSQATAGLVEGDTRAPPLRALGERRVPGVDDPQRLYELPVDS